MSNTIIIGYTFFKPVAISSMSPIVLFFTKLSMKSDPSSVGNWEDVAVFV